MVSVIHTLVIHPKEIFVPRRFALFPECEKAAAYRQTNLVSTSPLLPLSFPPQTIDDSKFKPIPASVYERKCALIESHYAADYNYMMAAGDALLASGFTTCLQYICDVGFLGLIRVIEMRNERIRLVYGETVPVADTKTEEGFIPSEMLGPMNAAIKQRAASPFFLPRYLVPLLQQPPWPKPQSPPLPQIPLPLPPPQIRSGSQRSTECSPPAVANAPLAVAVG
jgi:hypothetical protein